MNLDVIVLHNVSDDMFWRYDPRTSRLYHAHTFKVEADNIDKAADLVWTLANVVDGDDLRVGSPHLARYAEQVTHYRKRQNRSLSVGDALVFMEGERIAGHLWIAPVGFETFDYHKVSVDLNDVANHQSVSLARRAHEGWMRHGTRFVTTRPEEAL